MSVAFVVHGFLHKRYRRAPPPLMPVEFSVQTRQTVFRIGQFFIAFLAVLTEQYHQTGQPFSKMQYFVYPGLDIEQVSPVV